MAEYPHHFVTKGIFFKRTYCVKCGYVLENAYVYRNGPNRSCLPTEPPEAPMGVSNWIEHGKKYGYYDYAMKLERENQKSA